MRYFIVKNAKIFKEIDASEIASFSNVVSLEGHQDARIEDLVVQKGEIHDRRSGNNSIIGGSNAHS